jgi:hypothetical protein
MSAQVRTRLTLAVLTVLVPIWLALVAVAVTRQPAHAQTAGVQVTQFPGVPVELNGKVGETATVVTTCPAGAFAIAGGWSHLGAPSFVVLDNFASQLPGLGAGEWTLTVRKLDKGPLLVIPSVTCLSGVTQVPE